MIDSPLAVILSVRSALKGLAVLDIGCGEGGLAKLLAAEGALVTGIDPGPAAVVKARSAVPEAAFVEAVAEALPFGDASFDMAILTNALHHVPLQAMRAALREAARVLKAGGVLIVIEPLASGSFLEAMRPIDDETAVRLAAQQAIAAAIADGEFALVRSISYVRRETFGTAEQYLERIAAVDPRRRVAIGRNRDAVTAAIHKAALRGPDGRLILDQPVKADILRAA